MNRMTQIEPCISVIIALHNGTKKLENLSSWIQNQIGWSGALIVIASGETEIGQLGVVCERAGITFHFEKFVTCGHAKRNRGANIARQLGSKYIVFLNDYQFLPKGTLSEFEASEPNSDVLIGLLKENELQFHRRLRGIKENEVITKTSSTKKLWKLFSSVGEATLVIKTEEFLSVGGWRYPHKKGGIYFAGDGLLLASRLLHRGATFAFSTHFIVLGGHANPEHSRSYIRNKEALYPYAFTLSTMDEASPWWLRYRFFFGRIARIVLSFALAPSMFLDQDKVRSACRDISARSRPFLGFGPSSDADEIRDLTKTLCRDSEFLCEGEGGNQCRSIPKNDCDVKA